MFESLREPEDDKKTFQEAMGFAAPGTPTARTRRRGASAGFLGLSAAQRLVIALLLLLAVCVVGTMCLLVTGRIGAF